MKKIYVMIVAALSMMSCGSRQSASLEGEWSIQKVEGSEVKVDADLDAPFLGFNLAEKSLYGSTSCNRLTGALNVDEEKKTIDFSGTGSTRMMCHDMQTERQILGAMAKAVTYQIDGAVLKFLDESGTAVMELQKK